MDSSMKRSQSSGALTMAGAMATGTHGEPIPVPKIPRYLSVNGLTHRRKLNPNTGNVHGYKGEDYKQLNWPLPKMFGEEKYGFSLIDIDDPRFLKESAGNSKKLIRLHYDEQIIDLEWRKTYKALRDAEHRAATAGKNDKTKELIKKEVQQHLKYLLELQEQKDMYASQVADVNERCAYIKGTIKKENDLEELRMTLENHTKDRIPGDAAFWKTKFNTRSPTHKGGQDYGGLGR